ncbi:carboxypeptidase-like regulatory domain-containing protein [Bizionia myxarmorum]|uniref:Carboxypeptidase-like regulatory domain-containing protein n=1 Tax=Bizionia myxarmorum TaxID=291186 RepID=A0A5D0R7R6_9FLAO|nr:carboxypeptidase-like regulatory domain-containing protein [Bizionia myxarmorum]TYB76921.1 carboxypeptidase-like regulatory domain-containing protein [Bizionia myxarmorum]
MHKPLILLIFFYFTHLGVAQISIQDSKSKTPISYATVSFGDGQGLFADDEGLFIFSEKIYPGIDTLFVSALGYQNKTIATIGLGKIILLDEEVSQLDEVILIAEGRKFKEETLKPYLDDDYYSCWLPTIESEIAVFFNDPEPGLTKLSTIHFPITLESKDWEKRNRKNAEKKPFSTLFKVKFYRNDNGIPGKPLTYENIVFQATEKGGDVYNLHVKDYNISIPENGFFVSIQVLGYTDKVGKLLANKKYKELKGPEGTVRIPTSFRPLLPFTDDLKTHNTYIKRVFINGNNWVQFKQGNIESGLLKKDLNNYGIGFTYKIYKNE